LIVSLVNIGGIVHHHLTSIVSLTSMRIHCKYSSIETSACEYVKQKSPIPRCVWYWRYSRLRHQYSSLWSIDGLPDQNPFRSDIEMVGLDIYFYVGWFMVFNANFNNNSVISCRSVWLVE